MTELKPAPTPGQLADELESGRWEKETTRLGRDGSKKRCCLGVFCEMRGAPVVEDSVFNRDEGGLTLPNMGVPPDEIMGGTWLEDVYRRDEEGGEEYFYEVLYRLNDHNGVSFQSVIDFLRKIESGEVKVRNVG